MCVISEHITRLETPNFDLGWDPHWENVLIIDMSILTLEMDLINYTEAIGKKKIFKFMFKIFPLEKTYFGPVSIRYRWYGSRRQGMFMLGLG